MVGNDIVDIAQTKTTTNWRRPRFLDKLFTPKEQAYIHNSSNPFLMVWQLWSIKEAAYKLYTQENSSRFYNPKQFECELKNQQWLVKYCNYVCYAQTKVTSKYIISEARLERLKMTSKVVRFNSKDALIQSQQLRLQVLNLISETKSIDKSQLSIIKTKNGVPLVLYKSTKINLSISHHGIYGAYAIC
ncbi:4'-phosphopantetheinyl transferase superfamily protein [Winogradskyella sp. PE311]|uniref:4'-phosphopantetheinyl transferase family protein n=1 Tax=Winogradskyella sp. PE311 TaxID=3366943 RepID=UPI0039807038